MADEEPIADRPLTLGKRAADPKKVMAAALLSLKDEQDNPVLLAKGVTQDQLNGLTDLAYHAYGAIQDGTGMGLPAFEPATCGTNHLIAERTLRIVESAARSALFEFPSAAALETLAELCADAGVAFARLSLTATDDSNIPF